MFFSLRTGSNMYELCTFKKHLRIALMCTNCATRSANCLRILPKTMYLRLCYLTISLFRKCDE